MGVTLYARSVCRVIRTVCRCGNDDGSGMALISSGVRVGAAAFAVGLSLAGPQAVGVAAADSSDASSVSAGADPGAGAARAARSAAVRAERGSRSAAGVVSPAVPVDGAAIRVGRASGSVKPAAVAADRRQSRAALTVEPGSAVSSVPDAAVGVPEVPVALSSAAAVTMTKNVSGVNLTGADLIGANRWNVERGDQKLINPELGSLLLKTILAPLFSTDPTKLDSANVTGGDLVATAGFAVAHFIDTVGIGLSGFGSNPITDFLSGGLWLVRRTLFPVGSGVGVWGTAPCATAGDCAGADLTGADLEGADLSAVNLVGATLGSADLSGVSFGGGGGDSAAVTITKNMAGANLTGADLIGADLRNVDLSGAQLIGAKLMSAKLRGADLTGADLTGANLRSVVATGARTNFTNANLTNASLSSTDFKGANLTGVILTGATLSLTVGLSTVRTRLENATLTGVDLSGRDLTGFDFTGANLTDVNLSGSDLTGATLFGATTTGVILTGANLTGLNLSGRSFAGSDLTGTNFTGADLSRVDLTGADLTRANLTGATLTAVSGLATATLTGTNFAGTNVDLASADLSGKDLTGTNLSGANLTGANLSGATLKGADLSRAILRDANLSGANVAGVVSLSGANLAGANLTGVTLYPTLPAVGEAARPKWYATGLSSLTRTTWAPLGTWTALRGTPDAPLVRTAEPRRQSGLGGYPYDGVEGMIYNDSQTIVAVTTLDWNWSGEREVDWDGTSRTKGPQQYTFQTAMLLPGDSMSYQLQGQDRRDVGPVVGGALADLGYYLAFWQPSGLYPQANPFYDSAWTNRSLLSIYDTNLRPETFFVPPGRTLDNPANVRTNIREGESHDEIWGSINLSVTRETDGWLVPVSQAYLDRYPTPNPPETSDWAVFTIRIKSL